MKISIKLPKPRNVVAAEFFRSGANKPRVERSKKAYSRKTKHKAQSFQ